MNVEQFTNKVKEQINAAQITALQMQHQAYAKATTVGAAFVVLLFVQR
jgi:hypothetical protein